MFALEGRPPLPAGRYPCCGERAYKFETISRNTGCQFREHAPDERLAADAAVMEMYLKFRDIIGMRPPQLMFPERLTRLVAREPGEDSNGRLQCKEVFWWEGIQLLPPRPALGMLGKIYTSNVKFNPSARPGSPTLQPALRTSTQSLAGNCPLATMHTSEVSTLPHPKTQSSESSSKAPSAAETRQATAATSSPARRTTASRARPARGARRTRRGGGSCPGPRPRSLGPKAASTRGGCRAGSGCRRCRCAATRTRSGASRNARRARCARPSPAARPRCRTPPRPRPRRVTRAALFLYRTRLLRS
ncbi:uncharacterized protein LOC113235543 isoform X2 [Hyposmocoma kahamanoa]|uniref:uncharacterized protein LOC113235543 isoform X2 n=1 Tax=Hyposmocoma kahamanoa TaxID=1477025 RepID=UPI000E6D5FB7|nr:uncharacterized protein LOC113235543 isoform X2 [Hyposmocoma kahamanoa]